MLICWNKSKLVGMRLNKFVGLKMKQIRWTVDKNRIVDMK